MIEWSNPARSLDYINPARQFDFLTQHASKLGNLFSGGKGKNINDLPFEMHLPGYNYCGPGTKYSERMAKGQVGVNELDNACMRHDAVYNVAQEQTDDNRKRRLDADNTLIDDARNFRRRQDVGFTDKLGALATEGVIRAKVGLGIF